MPNNTKYVPPLTKEQRQAAEKRALLLLAYSEMTFDQIGRRVGLEPTAISKLNRKKKVRIFKGNGNASWEINPKYLTY